MSNLRIDADVMHRVSTAVGEAAEPLEFESALRSADPSAFESSRVSEALTESSRLRAARATLLEESVSNLGEGVAEAAATLGELDSTMAQKAV